MLCHLLSHSSILLIRNFEHGDIDGKEFFKGRSAFLINAERWGPCWRRSSTVVRDYSGPQSTGQPCCAYCWSSGMASWLSPNGGFRCMRPYLHIVFLTGISDGISSKVSNTLSMWLSCSFCVSGGRGGRVVGLGGSGNGPNDTLPTVACIGCRGAASLRNDSTGCSLISGTHPQIPNADMIVPQLFREGFD